MSGPLPELREALLDERTLEALLSDLASHAEVFEVFAKGSPAERASKTSLSLDEAKQLLLSRAVRAIQIRYRHEGIEWRDTLMAGADGVRLVRMSLPNLSTLERP